MIAREATDEPRQTDTPQLLVREAILGQPREKEKKRRRSGYQTQAKNAETIRNKKWEGDAFMLATKRWNEEKEKDKYKRKTSQRIVEEINDARGTNVSERTVRRYVASGHIGVPCIGRGRKCVMPDFIMEGITSAVVSYIQLSNAGMTTMPDRKNIISLLKRCLNKSTYTFKRFDNFYDRIMESIADRISVNTADYKMEQRRLIWTTYTNINIWFDTLKRFFIDKGFAREKKDEDRNVEGELVYFESQTNRILNLDESEVSTDGTSKLSGGRPVNKLCSNDSHLPKGATVSNKSGYSATFIGGSTVIGWPLPIHLQVKSEAQAENIRLSVNFMKDSRSVRGVFGFGGVREVGMTLRANPKAGMDTKEFAKYLFATIVPLYPDTADKPGKRVAVIVDSGPGRVNSDMLARLRIRGFYLIPGVPNTTHVTQATDKNYGLFKSIYRQNLTKLTEYRCSNNKTIQPTDIPLMIFGGDPQDIGLENAFERAFSFKKNVNIWAEIGVNPFNRKCLQDDKVKHEIVMHEDGTIDVDADPLSVKLLEIEGVNKTSIALLDLHGLDGSVFKICAPRLDKAKTNVGVTVPQSRARQDLLAKAATAGTRFYATGGEMLNSDDYFIAEERKQRSVAVNKLKTKKEQYQEQIIQESEAKAVINKLISTKGKDAYTEEGAKALDGASLKILYKWKCGKTAKASLNKAKLLAVWNEVKNNPHNDEKKIWTTEDQDQLDKLSNEVIKIHDTQVGREASKVVDDAIAVLSICSQDQLQRLQSAVHPSSSQDLVSIHPNQELQDATPPSQDLKIEQAEV